MTVLITLSILAVAVRLSFINQPYVDRWSWRQSDVAAIARNFTEHGFHFAYPQIDWTGAVPGYVGTEFPILPFVAAVSYQFTGVHEWIGRSESVLLFAVSLPFFFLLVREIFGRTAAVWATFFFSFAPLNIFAGRSFIPDVPSLSLALIGLYLFLRWIDKGEWRFFSLAALTISLSILIKATSIVIAAPLLFLVWQKWRWNFLKRYDLWTFAAIAVLPSVLWYWHAYQIAEKFYPYHFFGEGGFRIETISQYWAIAQQTAILSLTPILSIMALIGLVCVPRSKYSGLFRWWLVTMMIFVIVVGYGNRHPWYQLPFVPITAAFAGAACAFISSKLSSRIGSAVLLTLLALLFSVLVCVYVHPLYKASAAELRNAGLELNKITAPDALIIAADTGDPTIFYYAQRKGWHFLEQHGVYGGNPTDSQQLIVDLNRLRSRGATHLVFTTNTFWWLEYYPGFTQHLAETATLMETTPQFRIYKLAGSAK